MAGGGSATARTPPRQAGRSVCPTRHRRLPSRKGTTMTTTDERPRTRSTSRGRGVRPGRRRPGRRLQRRPGLPRRPAGPLARARLRPAARPAPSSPSAPASPSATCGSGSPPRPPPATSSTTPHAELHAAAEHAAVLADEEARLGTPGSSSSPRSGPRSTGSRTPSRPVRARLARARPAAVHRGRPLLPALYRSSLVNEWLPGARRARRAPAAGARVLDIGCGLGTATILMAAGIPALDVRRHGLPRGVDPAGRGRGREGRRRRTG